MFSFLKNNFNGVSPWDISAQHFSPFQLVLFIFRMEYYTYTKERENGSVVRNVYYGNRLPRFWFGFAVCWLGTLGKPLSLSLLSFPIYKVGTK